MALQQDSIAAQGINMNSGGAKVAGRFMGSAANGITANAGGGQTNGVLIAADITRVTTVASANDSMLLPASTPGSEVTVINAAASNSMNVFPQSGDAINAIGANGAFAVTAGKTATFYCAVAGQWHSILSA